MKISDIDETNLKIIRLQVEEFTKKCSLNFERENTILLDVAPQIYEGAKKYFKCNIKTLDINPKSNPDYLADICKNDILDQSFDYILCTEVLEHTLNPFMAAKEIFRLLKLGGLLFLTTPFNFRIHGPAPDCWRFTRKGLETLFSDFEILSLEEIETPCRPLMPIQYQLIAKRNS